jgi:hypothetical protein
LQDTDTGFSLWFDWDNDYVFTCDGETYRVDLRSDGAYFPMMEEGILSLHDFTTYLNDHFPNHSTNERSTTNVIHYFKKFA